MARSARGDIGEHWWSQRFVTVVESFALGSRLTRGKNYARQGQVLSLDVATGEVSAVVQGSRRSPYTVSIRLSPFTELVWAKVEVALAEQALHSARLLAGEMPPELEVVLAGAGAPLFPQRMSDLTMRCSCPDDAVPCKHLAATVYLLAESFDDDPFRILAWRGRSRDALLARLRELRGVSAGGHEVDDAPPAGVVTAAPGIGAAAALDPALLADGPPTVDPLSFWTAGPLPTLPTQPDLPADLLLRQLPDPAAVLGGRDLTRRLQQLYASLPLHPS